MAILWCGGEDIDFPVGNTVSTNTVASYRRQEWSRCSLQSSNNSGSAQSPPFSGGAVTACWISAQVACTSAGSRAAVGLGHSSLSNSGIFVGQSASSSSKLALWKLDAGSYTELATEPGASLSAVVKIEMSIASLGATTTINVYVNGVLKLTYSGDPRPTGLTSLDVAVLPPGLTSQPLISEVIVADEDTRSLLGLMAHAPSGVDAAGWSGAYTDVNEVANNDATLLFAGSAALEERMLLNALYSPRVSNIKAVKIVARALADASGPQTLKLGTYVGKVALLGTDDVVLGSNRSLVLGSKWLRRIKPAESATAVGLRFRALTAAATGHLKAVVYADSSGVPGARLAVGDELTGWAAGQIIVAPLSYAFVSGTYYWVGLINDTTLTVDADLSTTLGCHNLNSYASGPSDPAGDATASNDPTPSFYPVKEAGQTAHPDAGRALSTVAASYERLLLTNPDTGVAFTADEVNGLQLDLQSAA